ncbi:MAG: ABC-F family ATP-binding cassette domain-containing protein [bacterium]|nr:ABC-F family ATP-binding cassette domain-containing protein [bacterium]
MFHLNGIGKDFGGRTVLSDVSWVVGDNQRIGLCGPNGAGKTTLLRILARELEPDRGTLDISRDAMVGYLPQMVTGFGSRSLFAETSAALTELTGLEKELRALESRLDDEKSLARYAELQERFRAGGGYSMEAEVARVLDGLGFARSDWEKPCETFSGGWQMRIALARLLLCRPQLLLLDEPTNHLDLPTREWLEDFLRNYPFSVVVVSHDRYFLDQVVEKIVEVWNGQLREYPGNYTAYLAERQQYVDGLREEKRRQDEEIAKLELFVGRFRYQASKAAQVQSRLRQLEKMVRIEIPPQPRHIGFHFPPAPKMGRDVLQLSGIAQGYGDLTVLEDVNLMVTRGEKIALVGVNGAGKSTLMRILAGVEPPKAGVRRAGEGLKIGYFAQNQATQLDPERSVLEEMTAASPFEMVPELRSILGGFLFSGEDVDKKVKVLSGGERNRLAFACLLLKPRNLLLLDEPTNHLDMDSKEVLLDTLLHYDGSMVLVSHDRYFVDRLATRIWEVKERHVVSHVGNYADFLRAREAEGDLSHSADRVESRAVSRAPEAKAVNESRRQEYEERREVRREDRRRRKALEELETAIAAREEEVAGLEQLLADPAFYADTEKFHETIQRHAAAREDLEALYARWEELAENEA